MPTYRTSDGVVHQAKAPNGRIRLTCEDLNVKPWSHAYQVHEGPLHTHRDAQVTCFVCLADAPVYPDKDVFMACDTCMSWWCEDEDDLVSVTLDHIKSRETYTILAQGTLPKCLRCQ